MPPQAQGEESWPAQLPVHQVRIARPTDRLEEVVRFYRDGLGLREIDSFKEHAGFSGVMLGLPGTGHHLEFTSHRDGSPGQAPSRENLLVLYFGSAAEADAVVERLGEQGHAPVEAENPFWKTVDAVTVEDPDGWRVVLVPAPVC
jgi:catechol 2,3-dioxygenase-like lactoylglutathione lyase family enzyme